MLLPLIGLFRYRGPYWGHRKYPLPRPVARIETYVAQKGVILRPERSHLRLVYAVAEGMDVLDTPPHKMLESPTLAEGNNHAPAVRS